MDQIEKLRRKKKEIAEGASADVQQRLFFDKGMFPPRARIEKLLDPGTFFELDMLATHHCSDFGMEKRDIPAEGVITGFGRINGRKICVYSQDFSALGGTYGEMTGRKIIFSVSPVKVKTSSRLSHILLAASLCVLHASFCG